MLVSIAGFVEGVGGETVGTVFPRKRGCFAPHRHVCFSGLDYVLCCSEPASAPLGPKVVHVVGLGWVSMACGHCEFWVWPDLAKPCFSCETCVFEVKASRKKRPDGLTPSGGGVTSEGEATTHALLNEFWVNIFRIG